MGFLDWIKKGPEHAYQAGQNIKTVWKGGSYADKTSGYSAQACLGMSDKGYHAGLSFTSPEGAEKTTWHRPVQRRDHAMHESYSSFNRWVKGHQVQQTPQRPVEFKRRGPSWER